MATGLPVASGELVDLTFINGVARGYWRKTVAKAAAATSDTDLLNGEFTVPANALGTNRVLRLTADGDCVFNSGGGQALPRMKFKMGSGPTVLLDTSTFAPAMGNTATRGSWHIEVVVEATGATNTQWVRLDGWVVQTGAAGTAGTVAFATGQGACSSITVNATATHHYWRGAGAGAIDTTAAQLVQLTALMGSAASTDMTLKMAVMEII